MRHTIDGGGGVATGGSFELDGTIGQPDAGSVMTGGNFSLLGGFWAGGAEDSIPLGDVNQDGVVNLVGRDSLCRCGHQRNLHPGSRHQSGRRG